MHEINPGWKEPARYFRDRMRRYPGSLASGPEQSPQAAQRQPPRRDQSIVFRFMSVVCVLMGARGLTKIRIPSASVFQPSAILLSSSAIFEYIEKRGSELSRKSDSPGSGWVAPDRGRPRSSLTTYRGEIVGEARIEWRKTHTFFIPPFRIFMH